MRVVHVNLSDRIGGASIAMHRIHSGLREKGVDSQLLVRRLSDSSLATTRDDVHLLSTGLQSKIQSVLYRIDKGISRWQCDPTAFHCSLNMFPNRLIKRIKDLRPDIVNLHWVGANVLRIEDLPRIDSPIVWTLQDMWAFCGAEHYDFNDRWRSGYSVDSRNPDASGLDLNRHTWKRKFKSWKATAVTTVSPSRWMQECASTSALWKNREDCRHIVIPFGLDTTVFTPREKSACRQKHGLEGDVPLLLFGADRITSPMKGMPWLTEALSLLADSGFSVRVAFFGSGEVADQIPSSVPVTNLGRIDTPEVLAEMYCAADLMLVPSRLESFGQTASEAQACGTPVVCFDSSGLKDIVMHQKSGYRAKCYQPADLATGIRWCLSGGKSLSELGATATQYARTKFDSKRVASEYLSLYRSLIS